MQINVMDKSNFKKLGSTSSKIVTIPPDDKLLNCLATVCDINEELMVIKTEPSKCISLILTGYNVMD